MRLTEISVRALKGSDTYKTYFDDTLPGFGVRVGKRSKTFVVLRGKNRERVTIGRFGQIALADARKEAMRLLSAEPEAKYQSVRFEEAREAFLGTYGNPRTAYQVKRSLKRHFRPLEGRQLADLTYADVERCLSRIAAPSARLHAFRYARALFNWASKAPRKWVTVSPMHGYEPPGSDRRGTRTLTDDELVRIWRASPVLFRLMILWGTRNTETTVLRRDWVVNGVLTIPGEHTKNGRDHSIPVCPLAAHLLSTLPEAGPHFFAGRIEGSALHHGALGKLKRGVMQTSGTKDWQLRDIRRTFRSNMARLGVPREIGEVLINHAPPVLDDIYDKYDRLPEKRDALARYEAALVWLLAQG